MLREFKVPDLGEGLHEAVLVNWLVREGDEIRADQPLAEVETDKATSQLPSPFGGRVACLHFRPGDRMPVGAVAVSLDDNGLPTPATLTLRKVLAAPATRQLARQHGVDITAIKGTGPGGRITQEDVLSFAAAQARSKPLELHIPFDDLESPERGGQPIPQLPEFKAWGDVERRPITPIRQRILQRLTLATQIPVSVTLSDEADVTMLEDCRNDLNSRRQANEGRSSLLVWSIRAAVQSLLRSPIFNSSYDDARREIVYKKYINIGVAVDTPQGLLVPVIQNADRLGPTEMSIRLNELADRARQGKLKAEEMRGGTFTITNVGSIGGLFFTPIINWPEVAILGIGRCREQLRMVNGAVALRISLPLCLCFDHRIMDGADAARFLNDIKNRLENPLLLGNGCE
jgi:pyruvate dehydrogenase E2 component (dihydrolipoamide acetyltransferase)